MLTIRILSLGIILICSSTFAQLTINQNGNATVSSDLKVNGTTDLGTDQPTDTYKLRVHVSAGQAGTKGGIYASCSGGSNTLLTYGVKAKASSSGYTTYGIYSEASGAFENWAGYFNGNVYTSGSYQSSDQRLKKNIAQLDKKDILSKINGLNPVRYQYINKTESAAKGLPSVYAKEGDHIGLLAQEVEKIFPEFVIDITQVVENGEAEENGTAKTITTKAINYQELSVVLLAAIQELKAEVEELKSAIKTK